MIFIYEQYEFVSFGKLTVMSLVEENVIFIASISTIVLVKITGYSHHQDKLVQVMRLSINERLL